MPIYEYQCDNCGGTFEAIQKFSDAPLAECRLCGHDSVKKLLSAPAFRLKGSGWYETDFKKDKQRNVVKTDGDGGAAKPEAKTETKSSGDSASSTSGTSGGKSSDAA